MAPLTHPSIKDGWFREISSQWPGQAMTLKVNKILHIEKSLFQDVLVFESQTFGNVLVLDGVIQCTERDEFSYQEMIAHIPLASHPNPTDVLVIGGGDGGVVREVLKHPSVARVVLVDIDEAVVRVSRTYLPHMSALLDDPRVTVHIGDGFHWLAQNQSKYDVIITDSSDPVGPAQSLFQQPYFELLRAALKPAGTIAAQGECLWLHLPLIRDLRTTTAALFPVSAYAYTTIPTYPAGQIGFTLASTDPSRDLATPLRSVAPTRYYNQHVHRAAFVLPEFGRAMLDEGRNVLPVLRHEAVLTDTPPRKILLLGSGAVALPCAEYIVRHPANHLTIACRTLESAQALAASLPRTTAVALDAADTPALDAAVAAHDLVVSLIPYTHHAAVIRAAIRGHTHVVTTSYVSPAMRALDAEARAAGIVVFNEIGVDPGVDHLYAVKTIGEVHAKGGKVKEFHSYCGGLPAPECADNPLGYKFSWSPRGGLLALLNDASFLSHGARVSIPGTALMASAAPYYISPAFAFVAYPNRDSTPFREHYAIPEAQTVVRGTLRYQGFPAFVLALVKMGWLDTAEKPWLHMPDAAELTWAEATRRTVGASSTDERALATRIRELCAFASESEAARVLAGLKWVGFFDAGEPLRVRGANLLDTLCARLEGLMRYEPGERDMVMLQHKFVVEWADGREQTITSTLEAYGDPAGHSAMARYVGVPCGIAVQAVLDGRIAVPGVHAPYDAETCELLRGELEREGMGMVERWL